MDVLPSSPFLIHSTHYTLNDLSPPVVIHVVLKYIDSMDIK